MGKAYHLMLDGLCATPPSVATVREYLEAVAKLTDLNIIAGPFFFELESYQEAWAIVAESHTAVKWWPSGLVLVDLFSCKPFDVGAVVAFTVETFGFSYWNQRVIERMGVG